MKIVAQVKLLPVSAYDAHALAATLRACNRAANHASEVAFAKDLKRRNVLQKEVYFALKADYDLGAQPTVRVVKKVCDAYATLKGDIKAGNLGQEGSKRRVRAESKPITFREDAAQPFDDRILTWNLDARTVSIWTVAGRIKRIPFVCSDQAMELLASRKGESDLVMRDGMFFLVATVDVLEPQVFEPDGFLGVDLGIVNIATTSDGEIMAGRRLNRYRQRHRDLRQKLQRKRTKSAKRALKRVRRREARHAANQNHLIAKQLVATAERTSRGIALEDLSGIRQRVTAKKDQRARLHSWAFAQLGAFVEYKARRAGVPVVFVDPRKHLPPVLGVLAHPPHEQGGSSTVRLPVLRDRLARGPQRLPQHRPPGRSRVEAGRGQPPQNQHTLIPDAGDHATASRAPLAINASLAEKLTRWSPARHPCGPAGSPGTVVVVRVLLSIVVPCFNEDDVLTRFHARVTEEFSRLDGEFELVYVDDGSRDRTLPLLQELAAADPGRVRYVSFSRNFGKEAAMLAGLRHAAGDAVVIMDADLQHPPELVHRMVALHAEGYDQVVARRTREGDRVTRTLTARLYYRAINRLVDVELVDGVGDFRLLSRRTVDALLGLGEYNRFSKGLFAWVGFRTTTFSYENAVREEGRSKWTFGKLLNYGLDGLLSFNNKPLRAAVYLGLLLVSLACAYAAWIVVDALANGVDTPGYVTLLVAVTALAGVQMVMVGLIGEYVGRIYYEVKRRPHYLVQETEAGAEEKELRADTRGSRDSLWETVAPK